MHLKLCNLPVVLLLFGLPLLAQPLPDSPVVDPNGILNGASYAYANIPGEGLAPGSMFILRGDGLGPESIAHGSPPYEFQLPAGDTGTAVAVRALDGGAPTPVRLIYSSRHQVAGILPEDFPAGLAEVTLTYGGKSSLPVRFSVIPAAPGIFTRNMAGTGPAVAYAATPSSAHFVFLHEPALPGETLELWATGLDLSLPVDLEIGEFRLQPEIGSPRDHGLGLFSLKFKLPESGVPDSCYVPVRLVENGYRSRIATVAVKPEPGLCNDPMGLGEETLRRLSGITTNTGSVAMISIGDGRSTGGGTRSESAVATFHRLPALDFQEFAGRLYKPRATGACRLGSLGVFTTARTYPRPQPIESDLEAYAGPPWLGEPIDATGDLYLIGPRSDARLLQSGCNGSCGISGDGLPPDYFEPGLWTLRSYGGTLGNFGVSVELPARLEADIPGAIVPDEDLKVTWNGDGFRGTDRVTLNFNAWAPAPLDERISYSVLVECVAEATAGEFTVPAELLSKFPENASGVDVSVIATQDLATQPAVTIPGIDYAVFLYNRYVARAVPNR